LHSNTRKLRTKPWLFYWSYYTLLRGFNISNPIFFYWLLKWRNYLPPYFTYNHVGTYFQCYGRSNEFIIFTLSELNWTYFLSHVVSKIPIVTPPPCFIPSLIQELQVDFFLSYPFHGNGTLLHVDGTPKTRACSHELAHEIAFPNNNKIGSNYIHSYSICTQILSLYITSLNKVKIFLHHHTDIVARLQ